MSTMAQYGGRHLRNIFTAAQNFSYVLVCIAFAFLENGFMIILQNYPGYIDKRTQSAAHNLLFLIICDFFLGFFLPLQHLMTSREKIPELWVDTKSSKDPEFHVRKPVFIPRRDFEPQKPKPRKKYMCLLPSIDEELGQSGSSDFSIQMTSLADNFKERNCKQVLVSVTE